MCKNRLFRFVQVLIKKNHVERSHWPECFEERVYRYRTHRRDELHSINTSTSTHAKETTATKNALFTL